MTTLIIYLVLSGCISYGSFTYFWNKCKKFDDTGFEEDRPSYMSVAIGVAFGTICGWHIAMLFLLLVVK
jgi:hypothetical protein